VTAILERQRVTGPEYRKVGLKHLRGLVKAVEMRDNSSLTVSRMNLALRSVPMAIIFLLSFENANQIFKKWGFLRALSQYYIIYYCIR
jgi:hypothetical protein